MKQVTDRQPLPDPCWAPSVIPLVPVEDPEIDPNPMIRLFSRMEETAAEREIWNILDAINDEVLLIRTAPSLAQLLSLLSSAERLCRRADRLGLLGLAKCASGLICCLKREDFVGVYATSARLIRMADRSMVEVQGRVLKL